MSPGFTRDNSRKTGKLYSETKPKKINRKGISRIFILKFKQ